MIIFAGMRHASWATEMVLQSSVFPEGIPLLRSHVTAEKLKVFLSFHL